jgi:hypothetical protein
VAAFEKTELSQPDFCETRGLKLGTFRAWLYRIRSERGSRTPKLMEIVAVPEANPLPECVVQIGSVELRFSGRPEPEYLAALLRATEDR